MCVEFASLLWVWVWFLFFLRESFFIIKLTFILLYTIFDWMNEKRKRKVKVIILAILFQFFVAGRFCLCIFVNIYDSMYCLSSSSRSSSSRRSVKGSTTWIKFYRFKTLIRFYMSEVICHCNCRIRWWWDESKLRSRVEFKIWMSLDFKLLQTYLWILNPNKRKWWWKVQ